MTEQIPSPKRISFGLDTFGDSAVDLNGNPVSHAQTLRDIIDQAVLAEKVGVDFIGIGEHHREDYAVSAPDIMMTAILAQTEKLRSPPLSPCCPPMIRYASSNAGPP